MTSSDRINIAIAVGLALIAIIVGIANMVWASRLTSKMIQATLQSAQPAVIPPTKTRAKRLGPKQRHAIKALRMMRRLVILSLFAMVPGDLIVFLLNFPLARQTLILVAVYIPALTFAAYSGVRAVIETQKVIREVEAGNRRVINALYKSLIKPPPQPNLTK